MEQRVSVITLGVADVRRAFGFYQALGWCHDSNSGDASVFFQTGGLIISLREHDALAADSGRLDGGCWAGITLGYVVDNLIDVEMVLAEARGAGATIAQPATRTPSGGSCGVFLDPDGHAWEILHHPAWILHDDGKVSLQEPGGTRP